MTIHDVASQLYSLSVDHKFNGVRFTRRQLEDRIACDFRPGLAATNKIPYCEAMTIRLPDGEWLFLIDQCPSDPECFGYTIPDTREQEARLWARLTA